MQPRSWIELNEQAFNHNVHWYKKITGEKLLGVVVKSNAYGHGLETIAQMCQKNNAVDWLMVASLSEALILRNQRIDKPILVMYHLDQDADLALEYDIDLMVSDLATAAHLNQLAMGYKKKCNIHIKVDTGLSRFGFFSEEVIPLLKQLKQYQGLKIQGIYTHLSQAGAQDQTATHEQLALFNELLQKIAQEKFKIPYIHWGNSAAVLTGQLSNSNLTRVGLGIYGLWPSEFVKQTIQADHPDFQLIPIMTWKSRIDYIKKIEAGSYIGYDRTMQVTRPTTLAVLPVGYYDGYDRRLSNKASVLIQNQYAPVLGRIGMTTTVIDITNIPQAHIGQEVILMGPHDQITATHLATLAQSYNAREVISKLHERIPRVIK
jgi:alanine racemase